MTSMGPEPGRRDEPEIAESAARGAVEEPEPSVALPGKKRLWPLWLALGLVAAGGAGAYVWTTTRPEPLRVLVAIEVGGGYWEGSKPSAVLADALAERLEAVGFEPVKTGDPETDRILEAAESPEAAARALRAAFVIHGDLKPEIIEHPVEQGFVEVRVAAPITVSRLGDADSKTSPSLSSWAGARTKDEALRLLAEGLADRSFDVAVPALLEHPTVESMLEGSDVRKLQQLEPAKRYVGWRATRLDIAKRAWEKLDQEHAALPPSPRPIRYHGKFGAQDELVGAGPAGVLVHTAQRSPFVLPRTGDLGWITELETVVWRSDDGAEKQLWAGYHLLGRPSVTASGSHAVLVEDLFGWAKTITVIDAAGQSKRVRIDPDERFVAPAVSPDGGAVALYQRACQSCASAFVVVSLVDGKSLHQQGPVEPREGEVVESYGGYAWLGPKRVALLVRPAEAPPAEGEEQKPVPQSLVVVDLATEPPTTTPLLTLGEGEACDDLVASATGERLAMRCDAGIGAGLVIVDLAKKERVDTGIEGRSPSLSPTGDLIAFEARGDVSLYRIASREVAPLTKNDYVERGPRFSHDGARVYFLSMQADPNDRRRTTSVVASVEVAP
jgi:hypothetical protein